MKNAINVVKDSRGTDYNYLEFVSENGINYELLEGVSVGGKKHCTSGMMFIMLNTFNENIEIDDKLIELMGGSSCKLVDFFCSSIIMEGNEMWTRKDDESYIRSVVKEFEKENEELINFILVNNIPT